MRSPFLTVLVTIGLCASLALAQEANNKARRIQANVLGIDSHHDTLQRVLIENVDIGNRLPDGTIDIPRLEEGGVQ